jgi:hypothetical protein
MGFNHVALEIGNIEEAQVLDAYSVTTPAPPGFSGC